jgi:RNA polymerase sigma-70 factor (ECF subfamily)
MIDARRPPSPSPSVDDLVRGDESAFRALFAELNGPMLRFARSFIRDHSVAEEVVQDAWIAIIDGIAGFERKSSLKSWIFAIVANKAKSRARREGRTIPFAAFGSVDEPSIDADRFRPDGMWGSPPLPWTEITPERIVSGRQLWDHALEFLGRLPDAQRTVVTLIDIELLAPLEVCRLLEISEANQRTLLHRGRSKIRAALEDLLGERKPAPSADTPRGRRS